MLNCDELVRTEIDTVADAVASAVASAPAIAAAAAAAEAALKKSKKEKKKLKSVAGVPVVSKDNKGNNGFTFHVLLFKLACFLSRVSCISSILRLVQ
jgi:Asp-tRNA(Asn)/Glu-tRNA(Gln) amidotransferase A subunit family amidase